MDGLRIGVIGAGARAETFVRGLHAGTEQGALFGVCDIDEERLRDFASYCGCTDVPLFTDQHEFLTHPDIDAVVVAVPQFAHRDVAVEAIGAGKHIYLEKAMATSSEECREIIAAHRRSAVTAYLGFNLRASFVHRRVKEIVDSGVLGQIVHVSALEQLSLAHGAAFMRRYHRRRERSGGLLNTKCSHDLDYMQWLVGHEHHVVRAASFGGTDVFLPQKAPAERCSVCPHATSGGCPFRDRAGFVFPVGGDRPHHKAGEADLYGGDLCVYTEDKDIVDNQTVILEWDNGVRGSFNLQLFGRRDVREVRVFGDAGTLRASTEHGTIRISSSRRDEEIEHGLVAERGLPVRRPACAAADRQTGGHGGSDRQMLRRFMDAIEAGGETDSGLSEGLAATLVAEKADQSMRTGTVVEIRPDDYM